MVRISLVVLVGLSLADSGLSFMLTRKTSWLLSKDVKLSNVNLRLPSRTISALRADQNEDNTSGEEYEESNYNEYNAQDNGPNLVSSVTGGSSDNIPSDDEGGLIPRDGSLLLLIPSLAIAIGGFVLAANIAMSSGDAVSQAVEEMGESFSDKFKPKPAIYEASPVCRGICSNQEEQVDSLRNFMMRISGAKEEVPDSSISQEYQPEVETSNEAIEISSEGTISDEAVAADTSSESSVPDKPTNPEAE